MNQIEQGNRTRVPAFVSTEAISFGWNTWKANAAFFIGLVVVYFVISGVFPAILQAITGGDAQVMNGLITIVFWAINMIMGMGLIRIMLRFCDGEPAEFSELVSCYPLFGRYLVASILYGLIVLCGAFLLIVPGIYWAIQFQFFGYFIVDKGLGPIEALKASSAITRGSRWDLFLFGLLLILVQLAGLLCLAVGLLAAVPVVALATAFVYRKLLASYVPDNPPGLAAPQANQPLGLPGQQ